MLYPTGGIDVYLTTHTFAGAPQQRLPNCYVAPECTLALSGATINTAPSQRGDDDGSIQAAFTSTSGSTANWYLNGTDYGVHASPYTFTGLTEGSYQIYITQLSCSDTSETIILPDGEFRTGAFFVSEPQQVSAVENPIILQLQTAITSIQPKYSNNVFTVSGTITGTTINFALTFPQAYNAVFQSKGYPDRSYYFLNSTLTSSIGVPVGTNTNVEIATSLAQAFQQDAMLSRLYSITNSNATVRLKAKNYGVKYDLTTDNVSIAGGGVTLSNSQSGQVAYDGQISADYNLYVELYVDPDLQFGANPILTNFKKVGDDYTLPFQSNNLMSFDLGTTLKNFVDTPKPDFTFTGYTTLGNMDTNYYCKYGEKYPLIENAAGMAKKRYKGQTQVLYALNSALNFEDVNDMSDFLGYFVTNLNPNFSYDNDEWVSSEDLVFVDALIDSADTGTTNVMYSIWDSTNTSIEEAWQSSDTFASMGALTGQYYGRVSGTTNGETYMYSRLFVVFGTYMFWNTTQHSTLINNVQFLQSDPNPKEIPRGSKEFLYMLMKASYPATLELRGDISYWSAGIAPVTDVTFFEISNLTGATNFGGVTILACGYDELGLAAYEASGNTKIRRVDFAVWQIDAQGNELPLTETRSYLLNIDEQPQKYDVAFLNKLGTFSTYSFVGEVVEGESIQRQQYQVPYAVNSGGQANVGFQYNGVYDTKYTKTWTVNSGAIDDDTYYFLQDMLASNKIYNYSNPHENFLRVVNHKAQKSSNLSEWTVQVTFEETIFENNVEK